jgi:hypothetical protein
LVLPACEEAIEDRPSWQQVKSLERFAGAAANHSHSNSMTTVK